jgi:hypothetical protein
MTGDSADLNGGALAMLNANVSRTSCIYHRHPGVVGHRMAEIEM